MNTMDFVLITCICLVIYHHGVYPLILAWLAKYKQRRNLQSDCIKEYQPKIAVFMAAHNEQAFIYDKLINIASQIYPNEKIAIHLVLDGCTDDTLANATPALDKLAEQNIFCHIDVFEKNKGKLNAINHLINLYSSDYDVVLFSDVSAMLSINAFKEVACKMADKKVAVVSGLYQVYDEHNNEQSSYWDLQNKTRIDESIFGAVNGVSGSLLAIKSHLVKPLDEGTINDDFIQAVQAVDKEHVISICENINMVEMEEDALDKDYTRRVRICAGNWQQLGLLVKKFGSFNIWQKLIFTSSKGLRGIMPLCIGLIYIALFTQAVMVGGYYAIASLGLIATNAIGIAKLKGVVNFKLPVIDSVNYMLFSYLVGLYGIAQFHKGVYKQSWARVPKKVNSQQKRIMMVKRVIDVVGAGIGLVLTAPILLIVAIAIKLDSKGSVIYKQLRVGESTDDFVSLIYVYKLRSMYIDAEARSGAVWASDNDPRITRVGRFLRKTRLDELPQLWNVLKGEMSLIGPRPERPVFYKNLEENVPYFTHRTYQLKPGISGLAQVMNGYDENIEGVRRKIAWDYAYALSLSSYSSWYKTEMSILFKTIQVVLMGKGK
jgi:lipopolysaccharide/colanic/teichoic acid biosynthesis glycosyltransferase